jgi:hypothetical protein
VDGADPSWIESFNRYAVDEEGDKRVSRYRDWDNLKYLFRSFEKCTPWVRKIHFVTCGHLPDWLNTEHEKLNIVNHSDFIGKKYLPVFNANPIEINMHRIDGLSDHFVYFNDDMFLLKSVDPSQFFKNGLPRDLFAFNAISDTKIANIKINDIQILHKYFCKFTVVKKNFFKIFNFKNHFIEVAKTLLLMPWPKLTGFYDHHMPQPFLKKTFEEVWALESKVLEKTSGSKVRKCSDVNQYLFRYWHLCKGEFSPIDFKRKRFEWVYNYDDAVDVYEKLVSGKYSMFCINDGVSEDDDFERIRDKVNSGFAKLFPEKSQFEL